MLGRVALPLLIAASSTSGGFAQTLEVHNSRGAIVVEASGGIEAEIRGFAGNRKLSEAEMPRAGRGDRMILLCEPRDNEPADLEIRLPINWGLEARTTSGDITVRGMLPRADLSTDDGAVRIETEWRGARLTLDADEEPDEISLPEKPKFRDSVIDVTGGRRIWRLRDSLDDDVVVHGRYAVRAGKPRLVELTNFERPPNWPLRFHWEAPAVLDSILRGEPGRRLPSDAERTAAAGDSGGEATFRSDVRMVNLVFAVNDREGRPVADIRPEEFRVIEDGAPQRVSFAGSDEVPVNLAVLLDLSGSAKLDRAPLMAAAERFARQLRPEDRVALYAMSGSMFHVVSRLTSDRRELLRSIDRLPEITGASPLYDSILLAYDQDLRSRPGERNALVVISDGIDNQVSKQEAPSSVKLKKLIKAGESIDALIYPIFLLSGERFGRGWSRKGRKNLEKLAAATGGRLFTARSVQDLEPIFPLMEAELRSVYTVAYYPENQDFDGSWRKVRVEVDRADVEVRARPGYYAR